MNFNTLWPKFAFLLVHVTNSELPLVLFATAAASWHLAYVLQKQNAREREAGLARKVAAAYTVLPVMLWLAGRIVR